jgi:tetratricopeptide (TPR) repeat protein
MTKPIVTTIVAAAFLASSARTAQAAAYVPVALRVAPATAAAPAPAQDGETFESLVEQARIKFKDKDYVGAVALFERAYAVQPEPAILFNIGRIYEEANNIDAAIAYYEKFIADESVEMSQRDKALQRLQALEKIVEIRKKEEAKRNPKPADTGPKQPDPNDKTQPGPVGPQPGPGTQPGGDTTPAAPNKLLRPIGYTMLGVGAALLIGGGIAGGVARKQHGLFEDADTLDARRDASDRGKNLAATADGLFIAGGVLAAVGVILLVIPKARKSKAAQALRPSVSPREVGLGYVYRL